MKGKGNMAEWKIKGIFKGDADKVYAEINTLEKVTPENVLNAAQNEQSELHKCFLWDNDEAANKYRLEQARQIIQLLVVTPKQEEIQPTRIFQISSEKNVYQKNDYFLKNEDEYQILLSRAKEELRAIQRRYNTLAELEAVFAAIDEL
jgi:hypothetical protein